MNILSRNKINQFDNYAITYILVTRNHLAFLKITLEKLIKNIETDEEIVVVDGASTDGTVEYLQQLFAVGKINQLISEPDKNQAHGWNKALLMANGLIVKKIIDDDVFCYKAIKTCKAYMLANTKVDVVISNDLHSSIEEPNQIFDSSRLSQFNKWKQNEVMSFTFSDVHMLIRRSSLANIGLYNTFFVMMDWEYSLRISYLKSNVVYFTGYNSLSVFHQDTVTATKDVNIINEQGKRGAKFYEYAGDRSQISSWSKIKMWIGKHIFLKRKHGKINFNEELYRDIYSYYYNYIEDLNNNNCFEFVSSHDS